VSDGAKLCKGKPNGGRPAMSEATTEQVERAIHFPEVSDAREIPCDWERDELRQPGRVRLLWESRRALARWSITGFIAATIIGFLIPNRYTTTAQLMPPDPQSASNAMMLAGLATKAGGGLGTIAGDLLGLKSSGALFVGMLQSQTIQERLVEQFDLRKIYGKKLVVDARKELNGNTTIQEDRKSGIISIAVTDRSPERAANLTNAYVQELNLMVARLSTSSAHRERVFLEGRLESVKLELDDAEEQLAQFSSKNKTLDMQQQGKAMLEAAATLSGELIAAQSELEGLRQIYTDSNTRVREANARVGELRKQLKELGGAGEGRVTATSMSADPPAANLSAGRGIAEMSSSIPYPSLRELPLLGAKYADYYRRAKIEETVFELLTEQYELAKVEEAKETPSVKVLDSAEIPQRKSYPPRLMLIAFGTMLAFAASSSWIIGTARWNEIDLGDERKMLVREIVGAAKAQFLKGSRNGDRAGGNPKENFDAPGESASGMQDEQDA
jgi:uncharacterized protein involved in exopolysaccharide biosynthesis